MAAITPPRSVALQMPITVSPTEDMIEVARQVVSAVKALGDTPACLQRKIDQMADEFALFAAGGIRPSKKAVQEIEKDMVIYAEVPSELVNKYLNYSGYTYSGHEVVELESWREDLYRN